MQRVSELEKECDELRAQLQEHQNDVIRWQLKCTELEGKVKELEAKCSSSIVKVCVHDIYWYLAAFISFVLLSDQQKLHI